MKYPAQVHRLCSIFTDHVFPAPATFPLLATRRILLPSHNLAKYNPAPFLVFSFSIPLYYLDYQFFPSATSAPSCPSAAFCYHLATTLTQFLVPPTNRCYHSFPSHPLVNQNWSKPFQNLNEGPNRPRPQFLDSSQIQVISSLVGSSDPVGGGYAISCTSSIVYCAGASSASIIACGVAFASVAPFRSCCSLVPNEGSNSGTEVVVCCLNTM